MTELKSKVQTKFEKFIDLAEKVLKLFKILIDSREYFPNSVIYTDGNNIYWNSISSLGAGVTTTNNYSSLPPAADNTGKFYWCINAQGTWWLPGSLGGTYYPRGLYYSNGTTWTHQDTPYQATQSDVDAGIVEDQFVSPKTLNDYYKWNDIPEQFNPIAGTNMNLSGTYPNITFNATGSGSGEVNTASNVGGQSEVFKQKVGVDLQFRTIKAGTNITVTENANDIEISASGGSADGNGIYSGNGIVPPGTVAGLTGSFVFEDQTPGSTFGMQMGKLPLSGVLGFEPLGFGYFDGTYLITEAGVPYSGFVYYVANLTSGQITQGLIREDLISFTTSGGLQFQAGTTADFTSANGMTFIGGVIEDNKIAFSGVRLSMPKARASVIASFNNLSEGDTIYCTDCTADDSSTGVLQTYNGSTWKNHW